jgi:CheY-like chemotaxis protein
VIPTRSVDEARAAIAESRPAAIVLDVMLEGEASWGFLADLKRSPGTRDIPVLVVTVTNRAQKARALGADEFWLKPVDQDRLLRRLHELVRGGERGTVLVIDDDEKSRYIVRKHLGGTRYELLEAGGGHEGVELARRRVPDVILLDFLLPGMTAFDVLDELKSDPRTRAIPVIVVTSQALDVVQRRRLLEEAEAVISKQNLSRELAINRIRDALRKGGAAVGSES